MKKLLTAFVLLGLVGSASAELSKVGTAGAQFLKIGVGPKYQGMGEASVAASNDVYSMYWNPAGLVDVQNSQLGFTNVNWLLDVRLNYFAYARNFEDLGVFGLSASILSMNDQEITTFQRQEGTGTYYSASSYALGLTFARQLTARFAFGASIKFVGEKIHQERSQGIAFDFGTMLYTGFRSLRLGMSIANMGPQLKFNGPSLDVSYDDQKGRGSNSSVGASLKTSPYNLPLLFRVGMAYDVNFDSRSMVTLSTEFRHPSDSPEQGSAGVELSYDSRYFLRTGYKLNANEEGVSFGGGLKTNVTSGTKLVVDYSWQDFGRLESAQRFSVGFEF